MNTEEYNIREEIADLVKQQGGDVYLPEECNLIKLIKDPLKYPGALLYIKYSYKTEKYYVDMTIPAVNTGLQEYPASELYLLLGDIGIFSIIRNGIEQIYKEYEKVCLNKTSSEITEGLESKGGLNHRPETFSPPP